MIRASATRSWALSPSFATGLACYQNQAPRKPLRSRALGTTNAKRSGQLTALSSAPNLLRRAGASPTVAEIRPQCVQFFRKEDPLRAGRTFCSSWQSHGPQRSPRDSVERTDARTIETKLGNLNSNCNYPPEQMLCPFGGRPFGGRYDDSIPTGSHTVAGGLSVANTTGNDVLRATLWS